MVVRTPRRRFDGYRAGTQDRKMKAGQKEAAQDGDAKDLGASAGDDVAHRWIIACERKTTVVDHHCIRDVYTPRWHGATAVARKQAPDEAKPLVQPPQAREQPKGIATELPLPSLARLEGSARS